MYLSFPGRSDSAGHLDMINGLAVVSCLSRFSTTLSAFTLLNLGFSILLKGMRTVEADPFYLLSHSCHNVVSAFANMLHEWPGIS